MFKLNLTDFKHNYKPNHREDIMADKCQIIISSEADINLDAIKSGTDFIGWAFYRLMRQFEITNARMNIEGEEKTLDRLDEVLAEILVEIQLFISHTAWFVKDENLVRQINQSLRKEWDLPVTIKKRKYIMDNIQVTLIKE